MVPNLSTPCNVILTIPLSNECQFYQNESGKVPVGSSRHIFLSNCLPQYDNEITYSDAVLVLHCYLQPNLTQMIMLVTCHHCLCELTLFHHLLVIR